MGNLKKYNIQGWRLGVLLFVGILICYLPLQRMVYTNWLINTGTCFGLLWIFPRRYWPWIFAGFITARSNDSYVHHLLGFTDVHGGPFAIQWLLDNPMRWFIGVALEPFLIASGVLYLRYRGLRPSSIHLPNGMTHFHVAALITTLVASTKDCLYVWIEHGDVVEHAFRVGFGHFIGIILAVPLMCIIAVPAYHRDIRPLLRATFLILIPTMIALMVVIINIGRPETAEVLRRMLLIGVVVFALRFGWRGASIALICASTAIQTEVMLYRPYTETVVVQAFLALAGMMALMFGSARDEVNERSAGLTRALASNRRLTDNLASAALNSQMAEVQERRQLALELHDEFGQNLTALQTYLRIAETDPLRMPIRDLQDVAGTMRSNIQRVLESLRPAALSEVGLYASIDRGAIRALAESAGLSFKVTLEGDSRLLSHLEDVYQLMAYRIVQETVTNVVRHARASECRLRMRINQRSGQIWLYLDIRDNGIGRLSHLSGGNALNNLRERVKAIGGRWTWHELPVGLRVHILLRQDMPKSMLNTDEELS